MGKILKIYHLLTFFLIFVSACKDNGNKITDPDNEIELTADSIKTLDINDFNVKLSQRGLIFDGVYNNGSSKGVIFIAGLWVAVENKGEIEGDIVTAAFGNLCNYCSKWGDKKLGVYSLETNKRYSSENWPVSNGAPVDMTGLPKIYGDKMCWASLQSDTTLKNISIFSKPVKGLRVTKAIYGYRRDDLKNVVFIKYGITNLSSENWNDVSAGFYSDTDLNYHALNRTGYDIKRSLSYTYDTTANYVTGFTFLETPKNVDIMGHRIMRKNDYINPEFGEYSFTNPKQIIYTLKGLSNYGKPMINPVTGQETTFAFTGDPVTKTGWLDKPIDVRSIISTQKFSLKAGETTWVTLVWVVNDGTSLENSLSKLKSKIDLIRSEISLWQFH